MARPLAPHALSLALQYLLPPSELPPHLLSRPLLQRHHFLGISPSSPAAYLCWPLPDKDSEQVITTLEQLATQDHEHLVQTAEIRYQPASQGDDARALVWLGNSAQLVFIWQEDQDGAGWRYFDADHRPIPTGYSSTLAPSLEVTPASEQDHEQELSPGASHRTSSTLTSAYSSVSTPASDDYWAGYDSGSAPPSPRIPTRSLDPSAAQEEDAYWASYGTVHGSADSTIPSPAAKHKKLDAWGREQIPWDQPGEPESETWDTQGDSTTRHGLGMTLLSDTHPPTPPHMSARPLHVDVQAPVPLPGLDHRNWNSPPSSLSAPFSAMSEPDDAPLDDTAPHTDVAPTNNALNSVDAGLASAIKGIYALWKASQPDSANPDESRQAFLAVVGRALADV